MMGAFRCSMVDHPLVICALDTAGYNWYLDGDYMLQINQTYNDHPIWHKEAFYVFDYYIFLHTGDNTEDWYWAITSDDTFQSDTQIMAKCVSNYTINNISEPSDCPQWATKTWFFYGLWYEYFINDNFAVSAEICEVSDQYICIQSNQSRLGMIDSIVNK